MLFGLVVSGFADDYRIRPGDTIGITVMDEQDLTKRIVVDPEGNINLPLISQMKISDLTLPQATKEAHRTPLQVHKETSGDCGTRRGGQAAGEHLRRGEDPWALSYYP